MKTAREDRGMRMRLRAALVLVCGLAATAAWGGARQEAVGNPVEQEAGDWVKLTFLPESGVGQGRTYEASHSLAMGSSVVMLKGRDGWTDRVVRDLSEQRWIPQAPPQAVADLAGGAVGADWYHVFPTEALPLSGGRDNQGESAAIAGLTQDSTFDIRSGRPLLVAASNGETREFCVLLGRASDEYVQMRLEVPSDFFPGETAVLGNPTGQAYTRAALAFMDSMFAAGQERDLFRQNVVKASGAVQVPWGAYGGLADLANWQRRFLNTFQTHLKVRREPVKIGAVTASVPVLSWPAGSFDAVYSAKPGPYVAGWLRYVYEVGKPVLAGLVNRSIVDEAGAAGYLYSWKDYRKLNAEEGRGLAVAALRYLTWGYEYEGQTDWASPADRLLLRSWVAEGPGSDGTRDYLPVEPTSMEPTTLAASRYAPGYQGEDATSVLAALKSGNPAQSVVSRAFSQAGSPVAWVPAGVDTPRTFNYKLYEARRAKALAEARVIKGDLLGDARGAAQPLSAQQATGLGYLNPIIPFAWRYTSGSELLKPFGVGATQEGVSLDRTAGVDAAGLLSGALQMCGVGAKVLSVTNEKPGEQLGVYAAMTLGAGAAGLDAGKQPVYYAAADGSNGVANGNYRLSRADVERASVVVPDLKDVQPGDLVLGGGEGYGYELGIVVGVVGTVQARITAGYDARTERRKIIVLSVNQEVGHVFVSRWEDGLFTADADAFHLRRLVRLEAQALNAYPVGEVDLVTKERGTPYLRVNYTRDVHASMRAGSVQPDHRIPNTGEILRIEGIEVRRVGEPILSGDRIQVEVVGPEDYGYAAGYGGNVAVNRAGGHILFMALFQQAHEILGTFSCVEGQSSYTYTASPGAGHLWLAGGRLVYEKAGWRTWEFALSVPADAPAWPGDDILLRFAANMGGVRTVFTAAPEDVAVVYDKKLLWRANLYMVEKGWDWNDVNPWVEGNEWNDTPEGYRGVAGGQVVSDIKDTTSPPSATPGLWDTFLIEDAVAYSLQTHDGPTEFNRKMVEQQRILNYLIENGKAGYTKDTGEGWPTTTAPPSKAAPHGEGPGEWSSYAGEEVVDPIDAEPLAPPEVREAWPYRPCLSTRLVDTSRETLRRSAGVDCVGLVLRSASYIGEGYHMPNVMPYWWEEGDPWTGRVFVLAEEDRAYNRALPDWYDLVPISRMDPNGDPPAGLDRVVPGDIVYYVRGLTPGKNPGDPPSPNYHVMIVQEVRYSAGRQVTMEDITLIEAVWGTYARVGVTNRVLQSRTLAELDLHVRTGEEPRKWIAGRPILEGGQ